jgi:hypothetical protein
MAFYLDRQTYNAVGLSLIMSFLKQIQTNIAVFGAFGNDNAPLARQLTLPFTLNYKSFTNSKQ